MLAASSDRLSLYTALISGGAALLGALVGGVVSGVFTLRGEASRQQFARDEADREAGRLSERERTIARGASRVMHGEFKRALAILMAARLARRVWPEHSLTLSVPEDRKLIASLLDGSAWHKVVTGEQVMRSMNENRPDVLERFNVSGYDQEVARFMDQGIEVVAEAMAALDALTDEPAGEKDAPLPPTA